MAAVAFLMAANANASVLAYSEKGTFLAGTGATVATTPYPNTGDTQHLGFVSGSVTLSAVQESSYTTGYLYFGAYTPRLPGNVISINAFEDLDVAFAASVYAFGFDFVKPKFDPNIGAPFTDSTFTVTLRQGATDVGSFTFNPLITDQAIFVGASSSLAFNNVQIRETIGGVDDEFFGQFYTAAAAPIAAPIPEPGTWALSLLGLSAVGVVHRRRRQR